LDVEHKPLLLKSICALSIVLSSLAAQATDSNVAVVQAMRTAWLNGVAIPRVSAIFPGDIVQTKTDLADIDAFGSKVLVLGDSLLTYQGDGVELERGGVSVGTSKALSAKVGGLTVRPAAATWTEFQISNADETVHIVATKGDLILADENGTTTLNAGQETTREQAPRKRKKRSAGAIPAAQKSVMDKTTAMYIGGAAAGGVITWVLLQQEDPISPDKP
jgi:hypothetical protein